MSMTQAELLAKVKRYLAADESSPSIDAIHDDSIVGWANDLLPLIIKELEPIHYKQLIEKGHALTFDSGVENLPDDFQIAESVRVGTDDDFCKISPTSIEFDRWDYLSPSTELSDEEIKNIDENQNQSMLVKDTSLTFDSGVEDLPDDFLIVKSVRVGDNDKFCKLANTPEVFDRWDYLSPSEALSENELKAIEENRNQSMLVKDTSLTFDGGVEDLPDDFLMIKSIKVGSGDIFCRIIDDPNEFALWDSNSFVFTPNANNPIVFIADNKIYVKPTSITTGKLDYVTKHPIFLIADNKVYVKPTTHTAGKLDYVKKHPVALIANGNVYVKPTSLSSGKLDYVKEHPDIGGSQDTVFDTTGDALLIGMVVKKAKLWLQEEVG